MPSLDWHPGAVLATNISLRGTRIKPHRLVVRRYLWDEESVYSLHSQHY